MTIFELSNSFNLAEPPGTVEAAFRDLVAAMHTLCAAERDIVGLVPGEPAFDAWFRDAEVARAAVVFAAAGVVMAMALTPTDRRFCAVARNLEAVLITQDAHEYSFIAGSMLNSDWIYKVPGRGLRAARATTLLQAFRRSFVELLSFPDYTPEPPCALAMAMTLPMAA